MIDLIKRKRIYEPPAPEDGFRVLVDRLWPRGVRKVDAQVDLWLKDVAPSPALRTWFDHRADRWSVFRERYASELRANPAFYSLIGIANTRDVTLLYAAHDVAHNHAIILEEQLNKSREPAGS